MSYWKELLGELIGTFILVFIGCGSVAVAVLYYPLSLWQIALIWSIGVALAIFATRQYSAAHLNPAVTFAMLLAKKDSWRKLPSYLIVQLGGAVLASLLLLALINSDLQRFELENSILRGNPVSYKSAVMFGEFFPNTGFENSLNVSHIQACIYEGLGTMTLVLVIFIITRKDFGINNLVPLIIGLTVGAIIMVVAPYTQAGLNPARDFGPRLVAYFGGWEKAAFPKISSGFFTVYILSPMIGGAVARFIFYFLFEYKK